MKGLLITLTPDGAFDHLEDIGAAYVAGNLNANGHECIFCQENENLFNLRSHLDDTIQYIFFTLYNITSNAVYKSCREAKQLRPEIIIVVGGAEATTRRSQVLQECEFIDYMIIGEGETTSHELLSKLEKRQDISNINGIIYRKKNIVTETSERPLVKDIDTIVWPDRSFLLKKQLTVASISTSRGCPGRCSFCLTHDIWTYWRGRSIENIMNEIRHLYDTYQIDCINFTDASLEDPDKHCIRLNQLLDGILELDFPLYFSADFRAEFVDKVTPELMDKLKRAGLIRVVVGIESANEADNKLYNKIASVEQNYRITAMFQKKKIPMHPGFINFNPYTTIERLRDNLQYLNQFHIAARMILFATEVSIFKRSALYEKVQNDNLLSPDGLTYRYLNEEIKILISYLKQEMERLSGKDKLIMEIDTNLQKSDVLCYATKSRFQNMGIDAGEIFDEFDQEFELIKSRLNETCNHWYTRLLDATESGRVWQYDEITQDSITYDYLKHQLKLLRANMFRLFKNLMQKGYTANIKF